MKALLWILVLSAFGFLGYRIWQDGVEHQFCGTITDKYISNPYEHRVGKMVNVEESQMYLIFHNDSIGYLRIKCSVNQYYEHKIGEPVCYDLSRNDLDRYR